MKSLMLLNRLFYGFYIGQLLKLLKITMENTNNIGGRKFLIFKKSQNRHIGKLLYRRKLFMVPTILHTALRQ